MSLLEKEVYCQLECVVCQELMLPPIRMCLSGHIYCNTCAEKLKECPLCKNDLSTGRCYALEKLTNYVYYACKNKDCTAKFLPKDLNEHMKNCSLRLFKCSFCDWRSTHVLLAEHYGTAHQVENIPCTLKFLIQKKLTFFPLKYNGELFNFFVNNQNGRYSFCVYYIGPPNNAKNFTYKLQVSKSDESISFAFETTCIDVDMSFKIAVKHSYYFNIDQFFLNDPEESLTWKIFIKSHKLDVESDEENCFNLKNLFDGDD